MELKERVQVCLVALVIAFLAFAVGTATGTKNGTTGASYGRVSFVEKASQDGDAPVMSGGMSGRMTYTLSLDNQLLKYAFNGYDVVPNTMYALVNYLGDGKVAVIGKAESNEGGNIHFAGSYRHPLRPDGDPALDGKARIWLVPTYDLSGTSISQWDIQGMLFEARGIELN